MSPGPGFLVTVFAVVAASYFAARTWERRSMPAAGPLLAIGVLILGYLLVHLAVSVPGPPRDLVAAVTGVELAFGDTLQALVVLSILGGGLWFLFALQYTGRGQRLITVTTWLLAAFLGLTFLGATAGWIAGVTIGGQPVTTLVLSVGGFTVLALHVLGTFLVIETVWQRNAVSRREAGLLATGAVSFSLVMLLSGTVEQPWVPSLTLLVVTLCFGLAIERYPIFDVRPVVRVAGRDRLVDEIPDAVLVVDGELRVRDANDAATATFRQDREDLLGEPLEAVVPRPLDPAALARQTETARVQTANDRILTVTADPVRDRRGRQFGHVLRCTDVTERQRRERRLSVLHRLLAGTVKRQFSAVATKAGPVATTVDSDGSEDVTPTRVGAEIRDTVESLKAVTARTREIERGLADSNVEPVPLGETLEELFADRTADPEISISTPETPVPAHTDPAVLGPALELLVDDTVEPTPGDSGEPPAIDLVVTETEEWAEIRIAGNGLTGSEDGRSGPDREMALEVARLAVGSLGGRVNTETDRQNRPTIRVQCPRNGYTQPSSGTDALGQKAVRSGDRL